jgi:hypothetical protein
MSYYVRERAFGANWLLVGGSFISTWFPGSAGMWTVTAAASMAPRLTREPALGHFYERAMRGLLKFHDLLGTAILGPPWRSSLQVYRFFSRGTNFIFQRVNWYLRIKNERFGWFRPVSWLLELFNVLSTVLPTIFFVLAGGMALVRSRLEPDRRRLGRNFLAYFHMIPCRMVNFVRSIPQFLWAIVPRRPRGAIGPPRAKAQLPRADAAAGSSAIGTNSAR